MASEAEMTDKYLQLQLAAQTMRQMHQQIEMLDQQDAEIDRIVEGLTTLQKVESGHNIMVPLAEGLFVRAKLDKHEQVLVNVGSNVLVDKSLPDATTILKERKHELITHRERMQEQLTELMDQTKNLQEQLNAMISGGHV